MMRLPWFGKAVPHGILDILRGCNCHCVACYNAHRTPECKTVAAVLSEFAILRQARNLVTVTLSGGEPLLHPNILEIVHKLSHEGKVTVSMLTNGILFNERIAQKLADAGLDLVSFHIQRSQQRPDADDEGIDALRREKARIARVHGIFPALIVTLEQNDKTAFSDFARFVRTTPEYEYAVVTIARRFDEINPQVAQCDVSPDTFLSVLRTEGFSPAVFVGGRFQRKIPRWYIFQSVQALDRNGVERAWNEMRPSWLEWLILWGYAVLFRRSIHWTRTSSAKLKFRLLVNGLTGGRLSTFFFAVRAFCAGWTLREKHIIVQLPPYSLGQGKVECCDNCPDATIRNGRVHPLCLGDLKEEIPL